MGIFNRTKPLPGPYKDDPANLIYELLFCDDPDLYKRNIKQQDIEPWKTLFHDNPNIEALKKMVLDEDTESRVRLLAYYNLRKNGIAVEAKELEGVVVEVGLEDGIDVLASYKDGTARYINYTGKIIIWETKNDTSAEITAQLFRDSANIVQRIGPWNQPRRQHPEKGKVRISFLVSDGIYFGEGEINSFFKDQLAAPALQSATALMEFLTNVKREV